jgi:hypothetical protein
MKGQIRTFAGKSYEETGNGWRPLDPEPVPNPNGQAASTEKPVAVTDLQRKSWTAAELLGTDFPQPRFAVPGLIPEGLTFFAGAPKLGKSWLALGMGIAIAAGGRALGTIQVEAGDVLYLALEDSPRRLKERLGIVLAGEQPPQGLHFHTDCSRLGDGGAEEIAAWLDEHPGARLVVVDVFTRIRSPELRRADLYRADYEAAAELQTLAITRGIAIVAIYHTRKAEAADFVEMVQGTFGLAAGADTILVARRGRGEADATLHATGRDISEQELALRFSPEARTWVVLGDAAEYNLGETRRELLEAVRAHGSLSPKQAAEVTAVGYELAKKTLQRMANDGQLEANRGSYSLRTPVTPVTDVPAVPLSLGASDLQEQEAGDTGTPGTPLPWDEESPPFLYELPDYMGEEDE